MLSQDVRLSVRPLGPHTGIVSKRLNISNFFHHFVYPPFYTVSQKNRAFLFLSEVCQIFMNFNKFR